MIRRPPRSTQSRSSAASDVYKRQGFKNALAELGLKLSDEEMQAAFLGFLDLADKKKRVTAADVIALVRNQQQMRDDVYQLHQWRVDIASGEPATASVVLSHGDIQFAGDAEGNGPVDALLQAIDTATGIKTELEYYQVEAVTPGEDAQGQVHVRIRAGDGKIFTGHGLATDVVEASARAYLDALSRREAGEPSVVLAGSSTSRWG